MRWFKMMRQQKLLSLSLLLVTLSIGIVIGTLFNTGVHAARGQAVASDASPLVVPNAVQLGNEFTKLAKKLEPSVVYITADYTPKTAEQSSQARTISGARRQQRRRHGPVPPFLPERTLE